MVDPADSGDHAGRPKDTATTSLDWLSGGGEMGTLIRAMDWSTTPLGPVEAWPQSLRTTVSLCLSSTFPILIAWGPERVQIYNDTYRPICGEKHPHSMGQRFNECWASALPAVGSILDRAQGGEGSYLENLRMFLDRYGYLEEAWMTFSFSPIRDESDRVGGLFHPITEVTEKMLSARRTQLLRELATSLTEVKSVREVGERFAALADTMTLDVPFSLLLSSDAELLARTGWPEDQPLDWPSSVDDVLQIDDLGELFPGLACGPYPEPPRTALVMPLRPPGSPAAVATLIAGVSARRELDASYRAFYEQLAATLSSALANVLAYEREQERARVLAELDRAKTAFFSNVSHEFRTPLTLMLGPLEDALADALPSEQRERLELVQRSGLRLLKLVNTLLDFSRIEAGRVQASYEAIDLAESTRDLASVFRSTLERAGLTLEVECDELVAPAWVDREMWEKIVLNLLSNAFKHTFVGTIRVTLRSDAQHVQLCVSDSGVGIPAHELPRLFERFHRVEGASGRSYEGSGIGLALVQELVKLHGGSVEVDSELGRGSAFTVTLPTGNAHLPSERLNAGRTVQSTATRVEAFVHEASGWIGQGDSMVVPRVSTVASLDAPRIVLADDNADMRDYVYKLLSSQYRVECVADGGSALRSVRLAPPALVLSDVMMPGLDGFGLLRELKSDPRTAKVPVILLSARAGEEATLEGLQAGASDYLVKPFSARDLSARVESVLRNARAEEQRLAEAHERAQFAQQLMGIVSHDLRNPLNVVVLGAGNLLKRGDVDERSARVLTRVDQAAKRAVRLVRDLLDFTQARLGSGIPILPRALDLEVIVQQVLEELRASYPGRELAYAREGDAQGNWDGDRIAQVVYNLASNALKHGESDSVVRVRLENHGDAIELSVHNAGEPIADSLRGRLFQPLARGDGAATPGSIGLGLFIVDQLVRAHHGEVRVESNASDGTTFSVRLPLQQSDVASA